MGGESPNYSAFVWKTFEASGEGENVVRFQKFFLLAYFFIKTHGKINNNSDFLKMSKIWTGLPYTLSVREVWASNPGSVKLPQCRQRFATAPTFLRW